MNSLLTVSVIGLCVMMGIVTPSALAKVNPTSNYFSPLPDQWALMTVDFTKSYLPSTPRNILIKEGRTAEISCDLSLLKLPDAARSVTVMLCENIHGKVLWTSDQLNVDQTLQLPTLPRGPWWLLMKVCDQYDNVMQVNHLFLNVVETQQNDLPTWDTVNKAGISAWQSHDNMFVDLGKLNPSQTPATLSIEYHKLDGTLLHKQSQTIEQTINAPIAIDLDWLSPGITAYATLTCQQGTQQDQYKVLLGKKGHFPPNAPDVSAMTQGIKPVTQFTVAENMSAFGPFEKQKAGFVATLDSMSERGSDAVSIGFAGGQAQALEGVYDWTDYDKYIATLTQHRVPFLLFALGTGLFDKHPMDTWGDYMQTDGHEFKVWRNIPTVSPFSKPYNRQVEQTIRSAIARYKDNPLLIGYTFINQGGDSFIYHDHFDRITDYGRSARAAFRLFLQEKYATLDELNKTWGTHWKTWDAVMPAVPDYTAPVNLHPAWQDFNAFRLKAYSGTTTEHFDQIVDELDPKRLVVHYVAYTGPVEYIYQKVSRDPKSWMMCDGGGEHHTMDRLANMATHYGLLRRTESHNVPPANLNNMKGMFTNQLRNDTQGATYSLVWNSLPSLRLTHYPKNEQLQQTMAWWKQAMDAYQQLPSANTLSNKVAVMLSWDDMFYRRLAWRWYALPGEWARTHLIANGIANPSWVSAITPQHIWQQANVLLAPDDTQIWSPQMIQQVKEYVQSGRHLIVIGRSGQYSLDGSDNFAWVEKLGGHFNIASTQGKPITTQINEKSYTLSPTLTLTAQAGFTPTVQTPILVQWTLGQGKITWILAESGQTGDMAELSGQGGGLSELLGDLLLDQGAAVHVANSDPRVTGMMLKQNDKLYVLVSYYISMRKPEQYEPLTTRVTFPQIKSNHWHLKNMIPSQQLPEIQIGEDGRAGITLNMQPGDCMLYELIP